MINIEKNISSIIEIAHKAGKEILTVYNTNFDVALKANHTPITLADERSNQVITAELDRLFPSIPIISEETGVVDFFVRKSWEYFWLIDPLDGTKEFVKKNNEFCINIALIHKTKPVFGLIYQPITGSSMYNISTTVFKNSGNVTEEVKQEKNQEDIIRIVSSRSYSNPQTETMIKAIEAKGFKTEIVKQGSAIKFCLLAEGKADLYPRIGPTMEWDTAAGHALLEASGGKILNMETFEPLHYNKSSLRNPDFIASSKSVNHLLQNIL